MARSFKDKPPFKWFLLFAVLFALPIVVLSANSKTNIQQHAAATVLFTGVLKIQIVNRSGQIINLPQGTVNVVGNNILGPTPTIFGEIASGANGWTQTLNEGEYEITAVNASSYKVSFAYCFDCTKIAITAGGWGNFPSGFAYSPFVMDGRTTLVWVSYMPNNPCVAKQSNGKYLVGEACGGSVEDNGTKGTLYDCSGTGYAVTGKTQVCTDGCQVNKNAPDACITCASLGGSCSYSGCSANHKAIAGDCGSAYMTCCK